MRKTPRWSKEGYQPLKNTPLDDQGCEMLFQWLISGDDVNAPEDIFPRSVASITLTQARLGDAGFRAIVAWLESLKSLRDIIPGNRCRFLNLGFNKIAGSADLARDFNETHPCKLTELHASENHMGYRGVRAIIVALERCWTLHKVELLPNDIGEPPNEEENDEIEATKEGEGTFPLARMPGFDTGSFGGMHSIGSAILHEALDRVVSRNVSLKPMIIKEALLLLKYSRLMLQKKLQLDLQPTQQGRLTTNALENSFSFTYLPTEIQLCVLSPLAPTLSHVQRIRVFEYAVDPSTLPSLQLPEQQTTPKEWAASIGCDAFDPEFH
ncbi:hypothetical protein BJ912DRAFT_994151 [Pholiota molesta]|nr:hypothetical protein BJ912DRAFT_994151 [Pholiota molesta]